MHHKHSDLHKDHGRLGGPGDLSSRHQQDIYIFEALTAVPVGPCDKSSQNQMPKCVTQTCPVLPPICATARRCVETNSRQIPCHPMLASLPAEPAASSFRKLSSNVSNTDTELQQKLGVQQQDIAEGTTQQNQNQHSLEQQAPQVTLVPAAEINKLSGKEAAPAISVLCR